MKKILLSLFVGLIGLINFGYCYEGGWVGNLGLSSNQVYEVGKGNNNVISLGDDLTFCMISNNLNSPCNFTAVYGNYTVKITSANNQYIACIPDVAVSNSVGVSVTNNGYNCNGMYIFFPTDSVVPPLSSLQCQTEYNLIPISSIDQNYCTINGLCPSGGGDCPVCPGSGDNWSALYINDIQHLGKPIINITFPDYLDWDYTTNENEFNLDIVGYPVDTEYIDGIIRTQNYKPTSEDFTQLVGMLAPYSKYLLFLLFIFIIWAWIKKPFKSKKL